MIKDISQRHIGYPQPIGRQRPIGRCVNQSHEFVIDKFIVQLLCVPCTPHQGSVPDSEWGIQAPHTPVYIRLIAETNRRSGIRQFARRFTDGAEDRMPLVEDGELDGAISYVDKRRTAREAVSATGVVRDSANVSRLIERLMSGYDKRLRPNYKGRPLTALFHSLSNLCAGSS